MIYCSIDIETTGLDPQNSDILQFAAVLDDLCDPKPIEKLPKFNCIFVKKSYQGSPFALSMHPHIFRMIDSAIKKGLEYCSENEIRYMDINDFPFAFENWLCSNGLRPNDKNGKLYVSVAGKNAASFDLPFLKSKIENWGNLQFLQRVIDPAILYFDLKEDDVLPDMKKCMERAGILGEVTHNALEDAFVVVKLLRHKMCK